MQQSAHLNPLRTKQILGLKDQIPAAKQTSSDDSTWNISLVTPSLKTICIIIIYFPPKFPEVPPIVKVDKPMKHPWINREREIIGHPRLHVNQWNNSIPVASVLSDIIKEFSRNCPVPYDSETYESEPSVTVLPVPRSLDDQLSKLSLEQIEKLLYDGDLLRAYMLSLPECVKLEATTSELIENNVASATEMIENGEPLVNELDELKSKFDQVVENKRTLDEKLNIRNEKLKKFSLPTLRNLLKEEIIKCDIEQENILSKINTYNKSDFNLEEWKSNFIKLRHKAHLLQAKNEWLLMYQK